eukprot:Phypoly_transcript_03200.p1 GENE.Phypoly_transcript_03200~~Phypoly_transcript_03200.p1  ORF type:complete len:396 (+),score=55.22 Phypoly_transcript_03200:875-2062(+)
MSTHLYPTPNLSRNLVAFKLKENQYIGSNQWYLPYKYLGYNLFRLKDPQKICLILNYMNYTANFVNKYAAQSADAIFLEGEIKELAVTILKEFKLEIYQNPEHELEANEKHFTKFISNRKIIEKLMEATITDIDELFDENSLKEKEEIEKKCDIVMTKKMYENIKKELCKKNSNKISDSILKKIQKYPAWNMEECFFNENEEAYEIFIDETYKENKAGYGVFCKNNSKNNYFSRVEGEQTLQNATYQGILHVLKEAPQNEKINFILDRKAVIDVMEDFSTSYKERQNSLHLDTLLQIEEIIKMRTAPIKFIHCYSHTKEMDELDIQKNINNEKKIEKMIAKYGEEDTQRYIEGNKEANKLADEAFKQPNIKVPTINKYQNRYVLKSTKKNNTKKR